jgi:hypothetical protein
MGMIRGLFLAVLLSSSLLFAGTTPSTKDSGKTFVLDVVNSAAALPQPDPQDRLRVLQAAASIAGPLDSKLAHRLADEGAHLEAELITSGEPPVVSVFSSGEVDCAAAAQFVESVPASALDKAQDSMLAAVTTCAKAEEPGRLKLQTALDSGVVAAKPLLALMERSGASSRWSQTEFSKVFSSLPSDQVKYAPDFAAMFSQMAPAVDKDVARDAGLKFLDWLAKQKDGGERNLAVSTAVSTLREVLGEEKYAEALRSDVVAQSLAQTEGSPGEVELPKEDNVSVLAAMQDNSNDVTDSLVAMPATTRARDAAAHGFASGTSGDRKSADHYFDIAFSAADEVWAKRDEIHDAPAVVQEVSEAAAQVDAVAALGRAQKLSDPSAQAIGMLAVARVVAARQH